MCIVSMTDSLLATFLAKSSLREPMASPSGSAGKRKMEVSTTAAVLGTEHSVSCTGVRYSSGELKKKAWVTAHAFFYFLII